MKLLDTSVVIAICKEIKDTSIFQSLCGIGHEIAITNSVNQEILDNISRQGCDNALSNRNIKLLSQITIADISNFRNTYPYLGKGEIETILTALRLGRSGVKCYCILDDRKAKRTALQLGLQLTTTIGLVRILNQKGLITLQKMHKILSLL